MIVEGKKYACATCIKGHRSSSCSHTDRPLHEVKPKGRPVTQCEHCRDLRKTRQVHVKCNCNSRGSDTPAPTVEDGPKRKKPRHATPPPAVFPNGLTEAQSQTVMHNPPPRQKRRKAPKTCDCDVTGECNCCSQAVDPDDDLSRDHTPPKATTTATGSAQATTTNALMNSLIQVATEAGLVPTGGVLSNTGPPSQSAVTGPSWRYQDTLSQFDVSRIAGPSHPAASTRPARSCCNPPPASERPITAEQIQDPEPLLPPESFMPFDLSASVLSCSCGDGCQCPGCVEHRGLDALSSHESCPSSCSACFNCIVTPANSMEPPVLALPRVTEWLESAAATLPEPPHNSTKPRSPFALDATNLTVYSPTVWQNEAAARAAGLVKIPKLCCGGKCACPTGQCRCLDDCCGCCSGCACPEHQQMPHFSGYQGPLRCSFEVSSLRASCCKDEEEEPQIPGPLTTTFGSTLSYRAPESLIPLKRPASMMSADEQTPRSHSTMNAVSSISSFSRSMSLRTISSSSSPGRSRSPADVPLPPVRFQPAPGAFTLGQPVLPQIGERSYVRG